MSPWAIRVSRIGLTEPRVTVVTATFGRGRHILPTIRSVLGQTMGDFEYLVVGDGPNPETEAVIRGIDDPRLRWRQTEARWKTQSGANNLGIAEARGDVVAFLGHDDLWTPDHLERALSRYADGAADVVVSGLMAHPEWDWRAPQVMGLFDDGARDAAWRHFFPPTSVTLRTEVARKVGPWQRRDAVAVAVDYDRQDRLFEIGARFRSTGRITAHKFTSMQRYLSYLVVSSREQETLAARLARMRRDGTYDDWCVRSVAAAKAEGTYMEDTSDRRATDRRLDMGRIDGTRGVSLPENRPLGDGLDISQTAEPRGRDWRSSPPHEAGMRWTGPNHRANLLLPVTGGAAAIAVPVALTKGMAPGDLTLRLNGAPVAFDAAPLPHPRRRTTHRLTLRGRLKSDGPSVLEFDTPPEHMGRFGNGMLHGPGVGTVTLTPDSAR